jgi:hypothetical protein
MNTNKTLFQSKKAIFALLAFFDLNFIYVLSVFHTGSNVEITTKMISAILFLASIYTGVQGAVDTVQSTKLGLVNETLGTVAPPAVLPPTPTATPTPTVTPTATPPTTT